PPRYTPRPPTLVPSAGHSPLYAWSTARQTGPLYELARSPPCQSRAHRAGRETPRPTSSTDRFRSRTVGTHRLTPRWPSQGAPSRPTRWPDVPPHHCVPTTSCSPCPPSLPPHAPLIPVRLPAHP